MRNIIYVLLVCLTACGVKNGNEVYSKAPEKNITSVNDVKFFPLTNYYIAIGRYKGRLYSAAYAGDAVRFAFMDENEKIQSSFLIHDGKGPGEITYFTAVDVDDDKVYVWDDGQMKVNKYTLDGEVVDTVLLGSFPTTIQFNAMNDKFVFHCLEDKKLVVYSQKGELLAELLYPEGHREARHGEDFYGGELDASKGKIYLAYWNSPYRIDEYSSDLESERTVSRQFDKYKGDSRFYRKYDVLVQEGLVLIRDVFVNSDSIVTSVGRHYVVDEEGVKSYGNIWKAKPVENEINIFDKKSGNLKMTVWDKRLPYSSSGYTILDFDGSSLWLIGWKIDMNGNKGNYLVNIKL